MYAKYDMDKFCKYDTYVPTHFYYNPLSSATKARRVIDLLRGRGDERLYLTGDRVQQAGTQRTGRYAPAAPLGLPAPLRVGAAQPVA